MWIRIHVPRGKSFLIPWCPLSYLHETSIFLMISNITHQIKGLQGQVGWNFVQLDLLECVAAHGRGSETWGPLMPLSTQTILCSMILSNTSNSSLLCLPPYCLLSALQHIACIFLLFFLSSYSYFFQWCIFIKYSFALVCICQKPLVSALQMLDVVLTINLWRSFPVTHPHPF